MLADRQVQESTGFSPDELVFGHTVCGPLNQLYDQVAQSEPPPNLIDYISGFWHRLFVAGEKAKESLALAQTKMEHLHRTAEKCQFSHGDQVLVLLPLVASPFQAKFHGPYTVSRQISEVNYLLDTPECRRKTVPCSYLLKPYYT